jgi:hypothetical protein
MRVLATDGIAAQERTQHFAAHPGEHATGLIVAVLLASILRCRPRLLGG